MPQLEQILELIYHPRVVAFLSLCIGLYILRDVLRSMTMIFDANNRFWKSVLRRRRPHEGKVRDRPGSPPRR